MMDSKLLLPPTGTPLSGIEFHKRLPCGEVERARRVRIFFPPFLSLFSLLHLSTQPTFQKHRKAKSTFYILIEITWCDTHANF